MPRRRPPCRNRARRRPTRLAAVAAAALFSLLAVAVPASTAVAEGRDRPEPTREEQRRDRDADRDRDRGAPTPAQVREVLEVLADVHPELAARVTRLREEDPQAARRILGPRWRMLRRLAGLKREDPEMYALRARDLRLARESIETAYAAREARDAGDADAAEAEAGKLRALAEERFDLRTEIRRRELERLEQRYASLREELAERDASRDELIDRHVESLLDAPPPRPDDEGNDGRPRPEREPL